MKIINKLLKYSYFWASPDSCARYDSDLSICLSVDPLADKYPSTSPFMYVLGNPTALIDPNGMNAWIPPTEKGGDWTAVKGDSPGSLARDAGISQSEAESVMRNHNKGKKRSSDIMVYTGDKVSIPASGSSGNSSTSTNGTTTNPSAPSTASNTSGNSSNPMQTVNNVNTTAGIAISVAEQTVQNTQAGAKFAYAISGNSKVVSGVSNTFKYAPYVGLFVSGATGIYLSKTINPTTGHPYQSWAETGMDFGANAGTIYLGTQYGGWVGAGAATIYVFDKEAFKAYMKIVKEHPERVLPTSVHCFTR